MKEEELSIPTFGEAARFWFKLGWISFGGPSGQIAIMHREVVEQRKWISDERFMEALNYCMVLPGPEAQQLATYLGWKLHGVRGGIVSGLLFILPSVFILLGLAWMYMTIGELPSVTTALSGLKAVIVAIVAAALVGLAKKALKTKTHVWVCIGAFLSLFFLHVPFPIVLAGAALVGFLCRSKSSVPIQNTTIQTFGFKILKTVFFGILIWVSFPLLILFLLGPSHIVFQQAVFFSKAALVTFGGAYAVLPYVGQHAVETYHWVTPDQLIDALALAETTPGPLIMVLQFIGFLGAWQNPGNLSRETAATLGALITTWCTFVPSFIFIFAGAPYMERISNNPALKSILSIISACVVGVMLNLTVWFASVVFIGNNGLNLSAIILSITAFVALVKFKVNMLVVMAAGVFISLLTKALIP
ncbi:MAG: chromate efflux transporter [Verrucomicrobiota bacterium]|nr:chromate efflux transporter [Verrucomicrobiota bacterium]